MKLKRTKQKFDGMETIPLQEDVKLFRNTDIEINPNNEVHIDGGDEVRVNIDKPCAEKLIRHL